jgi:hypothetical protein
VSVLKIRVIDAEVAETCCNRFSTDGQALFGVCFSGENCICFIYVDE